MKLDFSRRFLKELDRLPADLRRRVGKQLDILCENPRHPSLQVKKMKGEGAFWEARVTQGYRIIFRWEGDTAYLEHVGPHDILRKP
ncbi:MAG: type II toxin-antitoxin system RelE/ParE family toxin [Candidatus Methylomirabilis sp.]|nr:type II toxin-antitoxin system RelE/ParE family toxin [Deltaproteobacteria bacterium]